MKKATLLAVLALSVSVFLFGCGSKKEEDTAKILADFLDDEMYYDKISQTHFHFVIENINDEKFLKDIEKFIDGVKYHLNQLTKKGIIKHKGSTKSGYWDILI